MAEQKSCYFLAHLIYLLKVLSIIIGSIINYRLLFISYETTEFKIEKEKNFNLQNVLLYVILVQVKIIL